MRSEGTGGPGIRATLAAALAVAVAAAGVVGCSQQGAETVKVEGKAKLDRNARNEELKQKLKNAPKAIKEPKKAIGGGTRRPGTPQR